MGGYSAENGNMRKSWPTNSHGTVFAPKQDHIERKLREWRAQKCNSLVGAETALTCAGSQTTSFHVGEYRAADKGNM